MIGIKLVSLFCFPLFGTAFKLTVAVLLVVGLSTAAQREEGLTLAYHRVVDKVVYNKAPSKHEHVVYRGSWGEYEIFVERRPTFEIPASGIVSVTVGKTRIIGNSAEDKREMERIVKEIVEKGGVTKRKQESYPSGFFYNFTFKLTLSEWKRYVAFNNKNLKGSFQMKLGTRDIGPLPFLAEESVTEGTEFTIATQEDNANRVKEKLSGLKNKVIWE